MARSNLDDLLCVLEEIRSEKGPDIPCEVIEKIAYAQYENQDNRIAARLATMKIVAAYLKTIPEVE
jgi:hypothetical protein